MEEIQKKKPVIFIVIVFQIILDLYTELISWETTFNYPALITRSVILLLQFAFLYIIWSTVQAYEKRDEKKQ